MRHLLRIDSISRHAGSHSRALADAAQTAWLAANPGGTVTTRPSDREAVRFGHLGSAPEPLEADAGAVSEVVEIG